MKSIFHYTYQILLMYFFFNCIYFVMYVFVVHSTKLLAVSLFWFIIKSPYETILFKNNNVAPILEFAVSFFFPSGNHKLLEYSVSL